MCTFWLVEALTRAGKYEKSFIAQAVLMFEDMITYSNHLGLYSEEITRSGEVFSFLSLCFLLSLCFPFPRLGIWINVVVSRELSTGFYAYGLY